MTARTDKLLAQARVFAALGDPTRLAIVAQLSTEGPLSIARLSAGRRVTRQAVTKHLHALHAAGVVTSARGGRERIWQLQPERLATATGHLEQIARQWDAALERLRAFVED